MCCFWTCIHSMTSNHGICFIKRLALIYSETSEYCLLVSFYKEVYSTFPIVSSYSIFTVQYNWNFFLLCNYNLMPINNVLVILPSTLCFLATCNNLCMILIYMRSLLHIHFLKISQMTGIMWYLYFYA